MKFIITSLVALGVAIFLALLAMEDPGFVVLAREPYTLRMPLALFVLFLLAGFVIIYLLLNFIVGTFRAPKKMKQWRERSNEKKAHVNTMKGYAGLIEGDWMHAERNLLKKLDHNKSPLMNYLGAAYASQQQGHFDRRDRYIKDALASHPAQRTAIKLTHARLLAQSGETVAARDLLQDLHVFHPKNAAISRLLTDVYQQLGEWSALAKLLPTLAKHKALPPSEQSAREQLAYDNHLSASQPGDDAQLDSAWQSLSRQARKNPQAVASYAKQLIAGGKMEHAESVIRKGLYKTWNSELAYLYGSAETDSIGDQIRIAESWAQQHADDPDLMLTLGRLYRRAERLQEARVQFQNSISAGGRQQACVELGALLEQLGETDNALLCYKRGIAELSGQQPQLPTAAVEGELAKPELASSELVLLVEQSDGKSVVPVPK